jgi:hypothetical protein
MSISKNERVLIVINHFADGDTDYLYRFIETAGRATVDTIAKLYGQAADTSWKDDVDSTKVIRGNSNLKIST